MWDNYASRKKKRYVEQIFNFALGMLKSLAHADLSGMSYKIDLNIYIYIYVYNLQGETWIEVSYRGRLAERHSPDSRVCQPPTALAPDVHALAAGNALSRQNSGNLRTQKPPWRPQRQVE